MLTIPALLLRQDEVSSLRAELAGYALVRRCNEVDELVRFLRTERGAAVIVAVRDPEGGSTAPSIRRIRVAFPHVPIVAYCAHTQENTLALLDAMEAGVSRVILRRYGLAQQTLEQALVSRRNERFAPECLAAPVLRELEPLGSSTLESMVQHALTHPFDEFTVETIARAIGIRRRTIERRLQRDGLPPPERIVGWCRILTVVYLMENRTRRVCQITRELGFSSASKLYGKQKQYTRLPLREVLNRGGVVFLAHRFKAELLRHQARCRAWSSSATQSTLVLPLPTAALRRKSAGSTTANILAVRQAR